MKKINYIILLVFLSLASVKAQDIRFETLGYMTAKKLRTGEYTDWSPFKKSAVVISFNLEKSRFVIYSKDVQMYRIKEVLNTKSTKNDEVVTFDCIDQEGTSCIITLATRKSKNNLKQLYINYSDFAITYNMLFLKAPTKTKN